jgi:Ca2+-binding RTX toxin-like protein
VDLRLQGTAQDTGQGMDTLVSIEMLSGTDMDDVLIGDGRANVLIGSGGDDSLSGGGGDDLIALAFGGDITAKGGAGIDTLQLDSNTGEGLFASSVLSLAVVGAQTSEAGTFTLKDIENLSGSMHDNSNDIFTGDDGGNILAGGLADDQLSGGAGDDLLLGDGVIRADFGPLGLSGPQEMVLEGVGSGADVLDGGLGLDTLIGGAGGDTLTGGAAKDTFTYLATGDSDFEGGFDLITDLARKDAVDLSAIDADTATDGDQAFRFVNHFRGHAGELLRSYDAETDVTHFFMDVDGDREADMRIDVSGDQHLFVNFVL